MDVDWVTQRIARLSFETDEMAIAELTLTPIGFPNAPTIVVSDDVPKMQHNLQPMDLIFPLTYDVSLKLTDMKQPAVPLPRTNVVFVNNIPDLDLFARVGPATHAHGIILKQLAVPDGFPQPVSATAWSFRYEGTVSNKGQAVLANEWVAARALIKGVPATTTQFKKELQQPGVTFYVANFEYAPGAFPVPDVIPGPFAIGRAPQITATFEPTQTDGKFRINFNLDLAGVTLSVGDTVTLCIEAIGAKLAPVGGQVTWPGERPTRASRTSPLEHSSDPRCRASSTSRIRPCSIARSICSGQAPGGRRPSRRRGHATPTSELVARLERGSAEFRRPRSRRPGRPPVPSLCRVPNLVEARFASRRDSFNGLLDRVRGAGVRADDVSTWRSRTRNRD